MGRIYEYDGCYEHEGYIEHQLAETGEWSGGAHYGACRSNGHYRAVCTCGWTGPTIRRKSDSCWMPEADEDRALEAWDEHMRPLVSVAKVGEADEAYREANAALRASVDEAIAAGASWAQIGKALGITKQGAWDRFGK